MSLSSPISSASCLLNTTTSSAHPPTEHRNNHTSLSQIPAENTEAKHQTMAGAKRIAQLAKKWQRMEPLGRKRLMVTAKEDEGCCTSVPSKGHCVVYTADGMRFEVPLVYLSMTLFGELLRMSQEESGFASDGKITLPCDGAVLEYVMSLLRRNASDDVKNALLSSMVMSGHYTCSAMPAVCSF